MSAIVRMNSVMVTSINDRPLAVSANGGYGTMIRSHKPLKPADNDNEKK